MTKRLIKFKLYACAAIILLSVLAPIKALAVDSSFITGNDILFYTPDDNLLCPEIANADIVSDTVEVVATVSLTGNDNEEKVMRFFISKGLTLAQAAGFAGNIQRESSFNPQIKQIRKGADNTLATADYTPEPNRGFGIVQWTDSGRQQRVVKQVNAEKNTKKRTIIDLSLQLDVAWNELNNSYKGTRAELRKSKTPEEAAFVISKGYEAPQGADDINSQTNKDRIANAKALYKKYSKKIPDKDTPKKEATTPKESTTPFVNMANSSESCSGDGSESNYIDGFVAYNQNDPKWDKKPYGSTGATIGSSGCGPSAMAMIVSTLTGKSVTPLDTATYGAAHGTYVDGHGSSWTIQSIVGSHWGLTSVQLKSDVAKINEALRGGALIITSGTGAKPFTSVGHFIVIRAVTDDGKWMVGDSNGKAGIKNTAETWDPDYILDIANPSNIWALKAS